MSLQAVAMEGLHCCSSTTLTILWSRRMSIAWLNHRGEWYYELDSWTNAAKDENNLMFDKDEPPGHHWTKTGCTSTCKPPSEAASKEEAQGQDQVHSKASKFTVDTSQTG
jgi:hypothetical protein